MNKIFLIDIDGTVCEDINNEDSHLFPFAEHFEESRLLLNKFHGLIMDKPRCKDGQEYHWIDNRPVKATTYKGTWSELIKTEAKIEVFK
jgi:hypothetical protein